MEHKSFPMFTKQIDGREVTGITAVFGNIDYYGDILHKGAFKKTIAESGHRVRHLWQHDASMPPTATIKELREVGRGDLPADIKERFPDIKGGLLVVRGYLDTPRGNEVLAALKADPPAISEMSFGYDPVKWDFEELEDGEYKGMLVRHLREVRLWDTSDVNWGANPATIAAKAALPFRDTGTMGEDEAWSRPKLSDFTGEAWEDLSDAEKRRIAAHYAWTANNPPESFADLKLPHHQPKKSGVGPAMWRGVRAAMGALLGARGGVDIPEGDKQSVYNHLRRHYEQYDKEPPDFKLVELAFAVKDALAIAQADLAAEPVRDWRKLADTLSELEELLRAEPPQRALTPWSVLTRLEIAQRELIEL